MTVSQDTRHLVTLGMFIIDEFAFLDENGQATGQTRPSQENWRRWNLCINWSSLPAHRIGMVVDRGQDFPPSIQTKLDSYGSDMWLFRDHSDVGTTRAINSYKGDERSFSYLTPRIRITPKDLTNTKLAQPSILHFICSPTRAASILSDVREIDGWFPTTIYEPIPDRCVPEELPNLINVLPSISVLSPNAEEALSLLSLPKLPTKQLVEHAASKFADIGVGQCGAGCVIIRSGAMGAYVATRAKGGRWIDAFWTGNTNKVIDVTGAGNSFLGGLAAGLLQADGDVYDAALYATVSAGFTIEQAGLPSLSLTGNLIEEWNGDSPQRRLEELRNRHSRPVD
ncbi:hypothetical protein PILCRDRAFT_765050 [Piloderma croceum F 1598]|uniref:Carbohydrate kinase PfkB domain-containing protein n=1 Tax=Piloderma croceum (strain F 1598) TaxID=765440 RepID=A0A0C3GKB4_PILCF|nr:hypothetical protein PILCRDRAFT_765050 [Piloderma croceum F 1598]